MFCRPLRAAWADAALLAGLLTSAEAREARRVIWAPPRWQYIHPVQDVQAAQTEVDAGFRSRGSVIAERGEDPEEVDRERAADAARVRSLGLDAVSVPEDPPDPERAARAALIDAQVRLEDLRGARERAQARLADAEVAALVARTAGEDAAHERLQADAAAARLAQDRETEARIARIEADAVAARQEADARMAALLAAEAHAAELRTIARAVENERLATARLEVEAARLGLSELAPS